MKTKYILHGGQIKIDNELNRGFAREFIADVTDNSQILLVFFAYDESEWQNGYNFFRNLYSKYLGKQYNFVMATRKKFIDQIKTSDSIILQGGDTEKIIKTLKQYPLFEEAVVGKTVAGSSAGAYALSEYAYSNDTDEIFRGMGILPIRVRCHYNGEDKEIEDKFAKYPESLRLELVLLKNFEYKIFYK